MNRDAIQAVALKDMQSISSNIQIWLPLIIVPLIFSIVLPGGLILGLRFWNLDSFGNMGVIVDLLEKLPPGGLRDSILQWDLFEKQVVYFMVNYLFAPLFIIIPLMISSIIAANSFVGEKERRTLESLLFAPVDIKSLFMGKVISAFVPAMVVTFFCALLYGLVVNSTAYPLFKTIIFPRLNWIVMIVWVIPASSLFAIFLNVVISAKVKGFQEAYQLGAMIVLPVLALFFSQLTGVLFLETSLLLWIGAAFFLIDYFMLKVISRAFDRNKLFESQVK
ncbi:MAG: ABC transporter permease [Dethiobacteria bacterium]|jgi:ABC-2 type transport system permease protein|nr:ABC transporter permease subunit [Bacillota bacterium]